MGRSAGKVFVLLLMCGGGGFDDGGLALMAEEIGGDGRGKGTILVCVFILEGNVDCGCHLVQERVCCLVSLNLASSA